MKLLNKTFLGAGALTIAALGGVAPARAGVGDLLVAPTRIVVDGRKGAEVILSNIGEEAAVYRVSVELRRMTADGQLVEVETPGDKEKVAQEMITFSPRRVTLAPNQPQSIRIAARAPANLPDGEYRAHLLFRAIPPAKPVAAKPSEEQKGLSFSITPIYGVTIPVIIRLGQLEVKAGIANVQLVQHQGKPAVTLDLTRIGDRSTFGEVRVLRAGVKEPIAIQRSVAVYTELGSRKVTIPFDEEYRGDAKGPVTVQYVETFADGNRTIAETQAVLR